MVIDAGRDTRKLYKIINNITGTKEDNPMPPGDSDTEIAQGFVEYFMEKIDKIRDKFECVLPYFPQLKMSPGSGNLHHWLKQKQGDWCPHYRINHVI